MTWPFAAFTVAMFAALYAYGFYRATLEDISAAVADVPYVEAESDYQWRTRNLRRNFDRLSRRVGEELLPVMQDMARVMGDVAAAFTRATLMLKVPEVRR